MNILLYFLGLINYILIIGPLIARIFGRDNPVLAIVYYLIVIGGFAAHFLSDEIVFTVIYYFISFPTVAISLYGLVFNRKR